MHNLQLFMKRVAAVSRRNLLNAIIMTVILSFYGLSNVQAVTPADQDESNRRLQQEELRRRTQQEAEERRNREQSKDTFLQPKVKPTQETTLPVEELSFLIHTLKLEGERVEKFSWL